MNAFGAVALAGAMTAAAAAGAVGSSALGAAWRKRALRQQLVAVAREEGAGENGVPVAGPVAPPARPSLADRLFQWVEVRSRALAMGARRPLMPPALVGRREETRRLLVYAGLGGRVSDQGFWDCSLLLGLGLALAGLCLGACLSPELGLVGLAGGFVLGFRIPGSLARKQARERSDDLERSLSEMLEVVALGLRSGLSFEKSLALYSSHFECPLARSLRGAQVQWSCGLVPREEALRTLAASYDSLLFGRVVESIIRSVRFGSSLAENLDESAGEARAHYRTNRQESVAKAPVKMMLPTSTLILPAMLILVLGPVLLELMG